MQEVFDYTKLVLATKRYVVNDMDGFHSEQSYGMWCNAQDVAALEAERDRLREALEQTTQGGEGLADSMIEIARDALAAPQGAVMSLLCQKRIEVDNVVVTYCMKPLGHAGKCETPAELGYPQKSEAKEQP